MVKYIRTAIRILSGAPFALFLFATTRMTTPWWGIVSTVVWGVLVVLVLWRLRRVYRTRVNLPLIALLTMLASAVLVSVIESPLFLFVVSVLVGSIITYIATIAMTSFEDDAALHKPVRRTLSMILVFVAYATTTFAFALTVFFPDIPFLPITLAVSAALAFYTGMMWSMYDNRSWQTARLWLVGSGLAATELIWIMHLLPFGYFVSGLLCTWIWYLWTLLGRFHLSPLGIDWKRQRLFLIGNIVLFVAILAFFVRWV